LSKNVSVLEIEAAANSSTISFNVFSYCNSFIHPPLVFPQRCEASLATPALFGIFFSTLLFFKSERTNDELQAAILTVDVDVVVYFIVSHHNFSFTLFRDFFKSSTKDSFVTVCIEYKTE